MPNTIIGNESYWIGNNVRGVHFSKNELKQKLNQENIKICMINYLMTNIYGVFFFCIDEHENF
jgi:hypothetical protein